MTGEVRAIPAKLGWRNPEHDGQGLRLYATDVDESPRWSNDSPAGRTIEVALAGAWEGDRCIVVRIGDRFVDRDRTELLCRQIEALVSGQAQFVAIASNEALLDQAD